MKPARPSVSLGCEGCGWKPPHLAQVPYPFACPNAGDGGDHVVAPRLDPVEGEWFDDGHVNPFVRFRKLLHAWEAAKSLGFSDEEYVRLVERLDAEVVRVDGKGFRVTPFGPARALAARVGGGPIDVKNETGGVSGSHKARHLFGLLIHLELIKAAGLEGAKAPRLAIASCGNAALAAAVTARAAGRPLDVFVPPDAHPNVLARLASLGADVRVCERGPGELGDPTVKAFQRAVKDGALPFACQGNENGLTLDGGRTLAFELVAQGLDADRVYVQVGGGALASSVARGLFEAQVMGRLAKGPKLRLVQGERVAPLSKAWEAIRGASGDGIALAARKRAAFFPPWPDPQPSVAHGILDDETYDGLFLVRAMLQSGGGPVVASEAVLEEAEAMAFETTGIPADATGTAGLAGLITDVREGKVPAGEKSVVLFTGVRR